MTTDMLPICSFADVHIHNQLKKDA